MGLMDRFRGTPRTTPVASAPVVPPRFAVIDVETTGLNPQHNRIVEIAVVTTDAWGRVLGEWSSRIHPDGPVGATHIHGITDADVVGAPKFADIAADLALHLAGAAFAAHNAPFDLGFLRHEFGRAGWDMPQAPTVCTLETSCHYLPNLDRRRLADCCYATGIPLTSAHSALGDARAAAQLLSVYANPQWTKHRFDHLAHEASSVVWPTQPSWDPQPWEPPHVSTFFAPPKPPGPALVTLVDQFSLADALDEGAPEGSLAYLEVLASALEDGEITGAEAAELAAVATTMSMTHADIAAANRAFVQALAYEALEDGKVSRAERAELLNIADLLQVNPKVVPALLDRAENARNLRLSEGLHPLPDDWEHGDPLRVGDKVVITGCYDHDRDGLETRAAALGVRILSNVSPKVALLVSDDTMDGGKAAKARELGTRTIHPTVFKVLLEHLQPALPREERRLPAQRQPAAPKAAPAAAGHAPVLPDGVTPADVRQWGRDNGWEVGVRGRLNHDLLKAYLTAQD